MRQTKTQIFHIKSLFLHKSHFQWTKNIFSLFTFFFINHFKNAIHKTHIHTFHTWFQ